MNPLQTGMYPQSQMDKTQFSTPTQMPVSREIVSSDYDTQVNPYTGEMPRFKEGGNVGIKQLAKYGRHGDTMLAHISPAEADMLKAMGGAGTINPHTGLPEYFSLGGVFSGITDTISKGLGTAGGGGGILGGLASLDKAIGKAIPGGWGTLASVAGAAMGLPTPALVGLGALNGSGVLHKDGQFNLQGALMGGAMAYGMSNLGEAIRAADIAPAGSPSVDIPSSPTPPAGTAPTSSIGTNFGSSGATGFNPSATGASGGFDTSGLKSGISLTPEASTPGIGDRLSSVVNKGMTNLQSTGQGLANLSGMGPAGVSASDALSAAKLSPSTYTNTALPIGMGLMSAAASDAAREYQGQSDAANAEVNRQNAAINAAIVDSQNRAYDVMRKNPYRFAEGGNVPRFLSGGGDGLSDDIPATIDGHQPARLADGEFVVSADVVSGLGGGSSKAGAKKLYDMMDRVRKQAHGTKKQIRPVSNKALPA